MWWSHVVKPTATFISTSNWIQLTYISGLINSHLIWFGTFVFLEQTQSMRIECALNVHSVPSANVPIFFC